MSRLPIDDVLDDVVESLLEHRQLVLEAPPGAGKTTRVPPAFLSRLRGDIVVLEPRRIAARSSAERVAEELGEAVGHTVGYQVRFESRISKSTRLRFVTGGVLLRQLARASALPGVELVVFDEFHERGLDSDLALSLVDALRNERPELKLLVMSATLDAQAVADFLGAPRLRATGRAFPVDVEHIPRSDSRPMGVQVVDAVRRLAPNTTGDTLVFLPGVGEIERCRSGLASIPETDVVALHGQLSSEEQSRVLAPSSKRRVVLSTNVSETSVTLPGVTRVIDSGQVRIPRWDPHTGIQRLTVENISRASADQRAGRAGRTAPGQCLRLYTKLDLQRRPPYTAPEITRADASGLLVAVLQSGRSPEQIRWLDPPSEAALARAKNLLRQLRVVDGNTLTEFGRQVGTLPLHPRLAAMVLRVGPEDRANAALAASMLAERDFVSRNDPHHIDVSDLESRVALFRMSRSQRKQRGYGVQTMERIERAAQQVRSSLHNVAILDPPVPLPRATFLAFSDRLVKRSGSGKLLLREGGHAVLKTDSVGLENGWLVALESEIRGKEAIVTLASDVEVEWIEQDLSDAVEAIDELEWDGERVIRSEGFKLDSLWLEEERRVAPPSERVSDFLYEQLRRRPVGSLLDEKEIALAVGRVEWARSAGVDNLPTGIEDALLRQACEGSRGIAELRASQPSQLLRSLLAPDVVAGFEKVAPTSIRLPSGKQLPVNYAVGRTPWLASYLQDFFGLKATPTLGRVPLTVHLWAPSARPIQVTSDLASFWEGGYQELRKQLSRRYPKHYWPDNPDNAEPRRFKRRR